MAKYSSKDVGFHVLGGYSLRGADSKYEDVVTLKLNETYALGDADEAYWSSGAKQTEVTQEGWFDDSTNSVHAAMVGVPTLPLPMCIAPHGNTNGVAIDCYPSVQRVKYTVQLAASDVTKAQAGYGVWYGKRPMYVAHALTEETAAGDNKTLDIHPYASNGANGGACVLHVTALSGCDSITVTLNHSTDGNSWADKQAFSAVTPANVPAAAAAGQYLTLAGAVNQYIAATWTFANPSSPHATFMVAVYQAP